MLRHPFYLLLCLFGVLYLALAGARGWSVLHTIGRGLGSSGGRGGPAGSFHHK